MFYISQWMLLCILLLISSVNRYRWGYFKKSEAHFEHASDKGRNSAIKN